MNKLIDIEKEQIEEALKTKKIPSFKSGIIFPDNATGT